MENEDGHVSYEFTDKLGQRIMTRNVTGSQNFDTYYVYDDWGNLRYVLPPMLINSFIHGHKASDNIAGQNISNDRGKKDHDAIKNDDKNHKGYSQYRQIEQKLITIDPKYEDAFKKGMDKYR